MAKVGRPTKYDPSFCDEMIKYFDVKPTRTIKETFYYKNGDEKIKEIEVANELPLIQDFCFKIDITKQTLHNWLKDHKDFLDAYNKAKELQRTMWAKNTLKGLYNAPFAIFMGKNMFGWRDKQEIDQTIHGEVSLTDILAGKNKPK